MLSPEGVRRLTNANAINNVTLSRHSCESRNPDIVPAKAGNQRHIKLVSRFHRKPWIPAYAEILMVQFILHWQSLLKPEIKFKIIEPGDRWFYPL